MTDRPDGYNRTASICIIAFAAFIILAMILRDFT